MFYPDETQNQYRSSYDISSKSAENPSFDINGNGTPKATKSLDIKSFLRSRFPESYDDDKSFTDFDELEKKHNISPVDEMMESSVPSNISPWDFSFLNGFDAKRSEEIDDDDN